MYIKLSLIFVVFVLFVAVFLYSTMVKSLRPFLEEATSLVLFCHLLGFSDPTGPSSPKKKVGFVLVQPEPDKIVRARVGPASDVLDVEVQRLASLEYGRVGRNLGLD